MSSLDLLMQRIGYQWTSPQLLKTALVHPSCGQKNNQRLEFLGDAVLELCISDMLYQERKTAREGQMTHLRATLVCEDALCDVAEQLDLAAHVQTHPPLQETTRGRASILADAMEAVIAAAYLDGGLPAAHALVERFWGERLRSAKAERNEKNRLQEILQFKGGNEPVYHVLSAEGPAHQRSFTVAVTHEGRELGRGQGSSKKAAEQSAALAALQILAHEGLA